MSNMTEYKNILAFHPGSYIEEIIEELNINQEEFAERLGVSAKTISKLVNGMDSISKEIALKLSKLTGVSFETWMKLQLKYDLKVNEIEEQRLLDNEALICEQIDFNYFKVNHFVENGRYNKIDKIKELRQVLKIADLNYLKKFNQQVSYRNTKDFNLKTTINSNVLLEIATHLAKDMTDIKFNKSRLKKVLPQIRELTLKSEESFYTELEELLLSCGIVLIGLPSLKNAGLNGATKRYKNGSVLLLLTDKNKQSDIFWFSLFHELGHILEGEFYSDLGEVAHYEEKESRADRFARDILIPEAEYRQYLKDENLNKQSILDFADKIGIHPSIIVGRLQYDKHIGYNILNELKVNCQFKLTPIPS